MMFWRRAVKGVRKQGVPGQHTVLPNEVEYSDPKRDRYVKRLFGSVLWDFQGVICHIDSFRTYTGEFIANYEGEREISKGKFV